MSKVLSRKARLALAEKKKKELREKLSKKQDNTVQKKETVKKEIINPSKEVDKTKTT